MIVIRGEVLEAVAISVPLLVAESISGEIIWASGPLERLFGCDVHGGLVGKQVEALLPARDRSAHVAHRELFASDPRFAAEPWVGALRVSSAIMGQRLDNGLEFPIAIGMSACVIGGRQCDVAAVIHIPGQPENPTLPTQPLTVADSS